MHQRTPADSQNFSKEIFEAWSVAAIGSATLRGHTDGDDELEAHHDPANCRSDEL